MGSVDETTTRAGRMEQENREGWFGFVKGVVSLAAAAIES